MSGVIEAVDWLMFKYVNVIQVNIFKTLSNVRFLSEKFCLREFCKKYSRAVCGGALFLSLFFMNTGQVKAKSEEKLPSDVMRFLHDADICRYLSGEWDSSLPQKRKNELNNEIDETCANIYERQRFMEDKYSNNKNILSKLKHMTFDIINREGF